MRGLADPDSKLFALLNKIALLMELNILVLVCCLPVVTIGAALCSMHTVLLKIYRDEEKKIAADFFHAMKTNLKCGTLVWLLFLCYLGLLAGIWVAGKHAFPAASVYVLFCLLAASVIGVLYLDWALILQSRYVYTTRQCLKYALLAWLQFPGSTIVYLVSILLPVLFCCSIRTLPLLFLLGITLPHMISTTLYSRVFDRMEGISITLPKL